MASLVPQTPDAPIMIPVVCDGGPAGGLHEYYGKAISDQSAYLQQKENFWYWQDSARTDMTWYVAFSMMIPQATYDNVLAGVADLFSSSFCFAGSAYDANDGLNPELYNSYTIHSGLYLQSVAGSPDYVALEIADFPCTPVDPPAQNIFPDQWHAVEMKIVLTAPNTDTLNIATTLRIDGSDVQTCAAVHTGFSGDAYRVHHKVLSQLWFGSSAPTNLAYTDYGMSADGFVVYYTYAAVATDNWIFDVGGTPFWSEYFDDGTIDTISGSYAQGGADPAVQLSILDVFTPGAPTISMGATTCDTLSLGTMLCCTPPFHGATLPFLLGNVSSPTPPFDGTMDVTIDGSPFVGDAPITYTFTWEKQVGGVGAWIALAVANTEAIIIPANYGVLDGDNIRATVTGDNGCGPPVSYTTDPAAIFITPCNPPVNTVAPVHTASGVGDIFATSSTTDGTWTGDATITFTYQWEWQDEATGAWSDITGATSSTLDRFTYVSPALGTGLDAGDALRCKVTGTNACGSSTATSNTLIIQAE